MTDPASPPRAAPPPPEPEAAAPGVDPAAARASLKAAAALVALSVPWFAFALHVRRIWPLATTCVGCEDWIGVPPPAYMATFPNLAFGGLCLAAALAEFGYARKLSPPAQRPGLKWLLYSVGLVALVSFCLPVYTAETRQQLARFADQHAYHQSFIHHQE